MPWINLTLRRGAFTKNVQHAVMAKLTDALMFWEKIPDTPDARKMTMGWVYEVAEDSDYNSGSPYHEDPFYFIEVRLLAGRFDGLTKQHLIRDVTKIIVLAEGKTPLSEDANRVWVHMVLLFDFILDRWLSRNINWWTHAKVKRILCFWFGAGCPFGISR